MLAGWILEARDFVQVVVIEPRENRLECRLDVREVLYPSGILTDFTCYVHLDAKCAASTWNTLKRSMIDPGQALLRWPICPLYRSRPTSRTKAAMLKFLLHIPIVLSLLVLGAHFLRYDNTPGVVISLALIGLLLLRKAWVVRVVHAALLLGAIEWALTLYRLVQMRAAMGEPATRMTVILGIVIAITAGSALLFQTRTLRQVYALQRSRDVDG